MRPYTLPFCLAFIAISPLLPSSTCLAQDAAVAASTVAEASKDSASQNNKAASDSATVDVMHELQSNAIKNQTATWGHWGHIPDRFSTWLSHSNRLIPMYTFGITLDSLREEGSVYTDPERLKKLYGSVPKDTVNPTATYFDQTDVYRLQKKAFEQGRKNIILVVFDGMDWQTTRAAAIYKAGKVNYETGRGNDLSFQNYRGAPTDFGFFCTSPQLSGAKFDVNSQVVLGGDRETTGGYDVARGGDYPWREQSNRDYLIGLDRSQPHTVTDSAASAVSMTTGVKTYNGSVNYTADGEHIVPIARELQPLGFKIGVVTSVPVSHATPAAAYANNVTRADYQDITRDLVGLRSASHREEALPGVDVLIGGGWGEGSGKAAAQGENFAKGNPFFHQEDLHAVDRENGGKYLVAQRHEGVPGREGLMKGAEQAAREGSRFIGFYGTKGGHLPFQTADGNFNPTFDAKGTEKYSPADIEENPTLADMTEAALMILEKSEKGFWLMVEAGDVDWANHANNLDNSIGAVLSGDAAFEVIVNWVDRQNAWDDTAIIVTSDHGHFLVIDDAEVIAAAGAAQAQNASAR
ncbi:Alkaline phosphatase 4 precursor [Novipirellula galeiformis]|uniref:Alkaline phosphatase 4 n=1 Tax=Novipirellula galeiformis TaxID=2528004 RepID=A0A5C6CFN5_9BACT|nr:alkaline phosphatase [Novipirellula galeiformis]TWU22191.1 Alkaline phosphatase 4 precursor [Novipirellula galeiformis]